MSYFRERMYRLLGDAALSRDTDKSLEELMSVFGMELDAMKDEIERFLDVVDIDTCPPEWLPIIAKTLGVKEYGTDLRDRDNRRFLKNAVRLYRIKGTGIGIRTLARVILGNVDVELKPKYQSVLHTYSPTNRYPTTLWDKRTWTQPEDKSGLVYANSLPREYKVFIGLGSLDNEGVQYVFDKYFKFERTLPDFQPAETVAELILLGFTSFDSLKRILDGYNRLDGSGWYPDEVTDVVDGPIYDTDAGTEQEPYWQGSTKPSDDGIVEVNTGTVPTEYPYGTWKQVVEAVASTNDDTMPELADELGPVEMTGWFHWGRGMLLNDGGLNTDPLSGRIEERQVPVIDTDVSSAWDAGVHLDAMPAVDTESFETVTETFDEEPVRDAFDTVAQEAMVGSFHYERGLLLNDGGLNTTPLSGSVVERTRLPQDHEADGTLVVYTRQIRFTGAVLNALQLNRSSLLNDNDQRLDTTTVTETRKVG